MKPKMLIGYARYRPTASPLRRSKLPFNRLERVGGLAEFERHLILSRTNEGRQRAKARGVRFGRKLKLSRHQILEGHQR